jgi:hypothetical protein
MTVAILAGWNTILGIGTIGPGAGINGANIGDMSTGSMNSTRTGGMMMTNRLRYCVDRSKIRSTD